MEMGTKTLAAVIFHALERNGTSLSMSFCKKKSTLRVNITIIIPYLGKGESLAALYESGPNDNNNQKNKRSKHYIAFLSSPSSASDGHHYIRHIVIFPFSDAKLVRPVCPSFQPKLFSFLYLLATLFCSYDILSYHFYCVHLRSFAG